MVKKNSLLWVYQRNWRIYTLMLPALVWVGIFAYALMYGLIIAFKDFRTRAGITGSLWADLLFKHFAAFFSTNIARSIIVNTLMLSILTLLISFPVPIFFALLFNQIKGRKTKKLMQTISYAPYFISTVVVVSILNVILSPGRGFVNTIVTWYTGGDPVLFMTRPEYFRPVYIISNIWQSMGFNAIIYIAVLTGISPEIYEAAIVDGTNKFQRIVHIDVPSIMPTAIIMFTLAVGSIMSIVYEKGVPNAKRHEYRDM